MTYKIVESPKGCKINYIAIETALNSPKVKPYLAGKEIDLLLQVPKMRVE